MAERDVPPGASPRSRKPPPESRRWQKGQSGNPKGRPSRTPLTDAVKRVLEREHHNKELMDLLAERIVKDALAGKAPLILELWNRLEGRAGDEPTPAERETPAVVIEIHEVPSGPPGSLTEEQKAWDTTPGR